MKRCSRSSLSMLVHLLIPTCTATTQSTPKLEEVSDGKLRTHSVHLQNTAGMDVLLRRGVIQYRAIGGTLDFRFFSGDQPASSSSSSSGNDKAVATVKNSPNTAIQQYVNFIGNPVIHPYWSYGFHLCRWAYNNVSRPKPSSTPCDRTTSPSKCNGTISTTCKSSVTLPRTRNDSLRKSLLL